eukprot:3846981-Pyramimonas_sp.AAC.1
MNRYVSNARLSPTHHTATVSRSRRTHISPANDAGIEDSGAKQALSRSRHAYVAPAGDAGV